MFSLDVYLSEINLHQFSIDALSLPIRIRPKYYHYAEGRITKSEGEIDESEKFREYCRVHDKGFFLTNKRYSINLDECNPMGITAWLTGRHPIPMDECFSFIELCSYYNCKFCAGCDQREFEYRNHFTGRGEIFSLSTYLGRDVQKYFPGVYWLTGFSKRHAKKLGVNLKKIESRAIESHAFGKDGDFVLYQFFEKPAEWALHADRLDEICEHTNGIFSKREVLLETGTPPTYDSLDSVTDKWK
jgi:hypothetical protein